MSQNSLEEQLYFPFMLDYISLSDYVQNEIPFMEEQHKKYMLITRDEISFNQFAVDFYCNPNSLWYMADEFKEKYCPFRMADGYIVPTDHYHTHD